MATSSTTADIQVIPFHNCKGCIDKVKREVHKLKGVQFIRVDPENGIFTFSTGGLPEVIRAALDRRFRKKTIILLPDEDVVPPPPSTTEPSAPPLPAAEGYVYGYPAGDYVYGYPVGSISDPYHHYFGR